MAEASIPVDLFNPGQVFACLGFLEAAEVLCGDAEGGFDWSNESEARFCLRVDGELDPVEAVLNFLAEAEIVTVCPARIEGPWPATAQPSEEFPAPSVALRTSDGKALTASSLPVRLQHGNTFIDVSHWLKGDGRETCKLFAGRQVGAQLAHNMLCGDPKKPASRGFKDIFREFKEDGFLDPFGQTCAVGGRFGFDARGGWETSTVGTSLDEQGVLLKVAPHVELLAAVGLQNARPTFRSTYEMRYAAWCDVLPVALCRVALVASDKFLPAGRFRFFLTHLGEDKQYKKCFFYDLEE